MYIQILTSAIFIATNFYGTPTDNNLKETGDNLIKKFSSENLINKNIAGPDTLETYVKEYFAKTPILAEIARCESEYKQTGTNGKIIRGKVNPADVGVMQINEYYHIKPSKALGHDLHTLEGNLEYAKWLYDEFGTSPWNASKACWGNGSEIAINVK